MAGQLLLLLRNDHSLQQDQAEDCRPCYAPRIQPHHVHLHTTLSAVVMWSWHHRAILQSDCYRRCYREARSNDLVSAAKVAYQGVVLIRHSVT
jgi:hypothetical protein